MADYRASNYIGPCTCGQHMSQLTLYDVSAIFFLGEVMAIDWVSTLQEQADFAKQIADDVAKTLDNPHLTISQAFRLYRTVEQGAQTFDRIIDEMQQHILEDELIDLADSIADTWTDLSLTTINKLRALQGLAQIELPQDDQDR
jgi:hypothetical protein